MSLLTYTARVYALRSHGAQQYGPVPYAFHLSLVVGVLHRFGHDDEDMIAAAWLHDALEDTSVTTREIGMQTNHRVAELVFLVTDGDGANRKQKKTAMYVKMLAEGRWDVRTRAINLKLADRIANVEAAMLRSADAGGRPTQGTKYLATYKDEHDSFRGALHGAGGDASMWQYLDNLLETR